MKFEYKNGTDQARAAQCGNGILDIPIVLYIAAE